MGNRVEIENIEERRHHVGIDDVVLREDIRGLAAGDLVKLTLLTGAGSFAGETVLVRITSIRGPAFRGKLVCKPASTGLSRLGVGSPVAFTAAHIHSLASGREVDQR
jgi:hypothetical protein